MAVLKILNPKRLADLLAVKQFASTPPHSIKKSIFVKKTQFESQSVLVAWSPRNVGAEDLKVAP